MLPIEGGIVRGVRRDSGGVPRSSAGGGAAAAAAAQFTETRTPGSHVRVSFARPDHPIAYGYPPHTHVFRQNFALYSVPRRWLRMAYCKTCLDGPIDPERSGHGMGRSRRRAASWSAGRPGARTISSAVPRSSTCRSGKGHVVAFNFNPLHRDLNRGDQRMLWNAIINWQAIVARH